MAPISLDPNSDIKFRVIQRGPVSSKQTEFRALTAALSVSPYWKAFIKHMDGSSGFKPNKTHIEDTGITIVAVEIVLCALHRFYHRRQVNSDEHHDSIESNAEEKVKNTSNAENEGLVPSKIALADHTPVSTKLEDDDPDSSPDLSDMELYFPHELSRANIDDIWGLLALLNLDVHGKKQRKFGVDWTVVRPWFFKWRKIALTTFKTKEDFEKLLFPTFAFRDPEGFRSTAKWLCQNTSVGNIEEYSPLVHSQKTQWYLHLHLPKEAISWVRIARSKLRTDVSNQIWSIVRGGRGWLSDSKCDCWVVAQYNYLKALKKAGVLCPEISRRKTVMELVDLINTVEYEEPLDPCLECSKANITNHLRSAIEVALGCKTVDGRDLPEPLDGIDTKQKKFRNKSQKPRRPSHTARN